MLRTKAGTTRDTLSAEQAEALRLIESSELPYVIGLDETGYGSWAGPVVVCAAVVNHGWVNSRVKDSKLLSPERRRDLVEHVLVPPAVIYFCIMEYDSIKIDQMGVAKARDDLVVKAARQCLRQYPDAVVVMDGNQAPTGLPAVTLCMPKADNLVPAVSAASIIAKVHRDALMYAFAKKYPNYGFERHVGYGTAQHLACLEAFGVSEIHRKSYQNIKKLLQK